MSGRSEGRKEEKAEEGNRVSLTRKDRKKDEKTALPPIMASAFILLQHAFLFPNSPIYYNHARVKGCEEGEKKGKERQKTSLEECHIMMNSSLKCLPYQTGKLGLFETLKKKRNGRKKRRTVHLAFMTCILKKKRRKEGRKTHVYMW